MFKFLLHLLNFRGMHKPKGEKWFNPPPIKHLFVSSNFRDTAQCTHLFQFSQKVMSAAARRSHSRLLDPLPTIKIN